MFSVKLRKGESFESLVKRFLRKTKNEKIIDECIERSFYKKPSKKKREAHYKRLAILRKLRRKEEQSHQRDK